MKNIRVFLSENFQSLEMNFSIHLNRRVFVMSSLQYGDLNEDMTNRKILTRRVAAQTSLELCYSNMPVSLFVSREHLPWCTVNGIQASHTLINCIIHALGTRTQ